MSHNDDDLWQEAANEVWEMIESGGYQFALEYLDNIHKWIVKNGHVTEKQLEAIENIKNSRTNYKE
jgi:hypothetical protein